jgi:hypothetical protein
MRSGAWFAGVLVFAGACGPPHIGPLPPWTEPLDATNQATDPAPQPDAPYPEQLNVVTGTLQDSYSWGHCRGWIHGSIESVWAAMRNANVVVDRRTLTSWTVTGTNVDPTADVSFIVKNVVVNVITVVIDTEREGVISGSKETPTKVAVRNSLIDGSIFVTVVDDSALLTAQDSETTEIQLERHSQTASPTQESDVKRYEQDLFNSIVAQVHGQPLPKY